jgi:hypothetical protein
VQTTGDVVDAPAESVETEDAVERPAEDVESR